MKHKPTLAYPPIAELKTKAEIKINSKTLHARLYRHGWNISEALTIPVGEPRQPRRPPLWQTYCKQRRSANRRKIPFLLSYDEWFKIWNDSGHLAERGKGRDRYCMARPGDTGPYAVGNIIIITNSENSQQMVNRLRATGTHFLTQTSSREERVMWTNKGGKKSWERMTPKQRRERVRKMGKNSWVRMSPAAREARIRGLYNREPQPPAAVVLARRFRNEGGTLRQISKKLFTLGYRTKHDGELSSSMVYKMVKGLGNYVLREHAMLPPSAEER